MKLYFKQRFFSWFDSYDIYDYDTGDVVYTVEGQLAWGHCLHILDADGRHIATQSAVRSCTAKVNTGCCSPFTESRAPASSALEMM